MIAPEPAEPLTHAGTVALVGRSNVGKSTLLNALLGEQLSIVSANPQTTRTSILGVVHHRSAQIAVLDTPGLHKPRSHLGQRMNAAARTSAHQADVVLFVTTPGPLNHEGELSVEPRDVVLLRDVGEGKPTLLVVNKIDTIRQKVQLFALLEKFAALRDFTAYVPISAKRRSGLGRLLDEIVLHVPAGPPLFASDDLTNRPVQFFAAEYLRESILVSVRKEVPYAVTVSIDSFDETPKGTRITATIHVEKEGQKAILIGKGGTQLREIGTRARLRIARFLDRTTHLSLFVRVTPGWSDSPRMLDEMGYGVHGEGSL